MITHGVILRLDGEYIGDVRRIATALKFTKARTAVGVDSISFSLNDKIFKEWLAQRTQQPINKVLRPYALDCKVVRNGKEIVGGYLATKPAYAPNGTSATISLQFDGYMNLLAGVYIEPTPKQTARMNQLIVDYITMAENRATAAGKGFGITAGDIQQLPTVTQTFDSYKSVKEFITDRCDNVTGAGPFEVEFNPDRSYDVTADADFGRVRTYSIRYPSTFTSISAMSISAGEVSGFASAVIAVGGGSTSSEEVDDTAIVSKKYNNAAVVEYGYCEYYMEESSISRQETLDGKAQSTLDELSNPDWQPQISLSGEQIGLSSEAGNNIWIGDTITIKNENDLLGATSGKFRVSQIDVDVGESDGEVIKPTLERITDEQDIA